MDKRTRSRLSKTLLAMLAYSPGEFRLVGGSGGWIKISEAAKALHEEGLFRFVTEASLKQFVTLFCSDLFELNHDSSLIRCRDEVLRAKAFEYPISFPPERLFCAFRKRAAFNVEKGGLEAHRRSALGGPLSGSGLRHLAWKEAGCL
jgi:RNA:NAD 2'-phosphotransferase (TPT1/KptA family)